MTNESPDTIHGRLKEGAHVAGYGAERALQNFKALLENERWSELDAGFKTVNEFLADVQGAFSGFKLLAEDRKEIVRLIDAQQPDAHNTKIAGALGVSEKTVRLDRGISECSEPDTEEDADISECSEPGPVQEFPGDKAAEFVAKKIENERKKIERKAEIESQKEAIETGTIKLPEGVFEVIAVDPPWPYGTEYDPSGRRAANPYPEMSIEELKALVLPTAENSILWLWTTHKFMRHSFELLDAWGFEDKAIVTWVKDRMGLGQWLRSQSEFCIMAIKGKPLIRLTNQTTIINAPMREHSRKPDEFYAMVDRLCIGRKLDYYSREERPGWEQHGNDPNKFASE